MHLCSSTGYPRATHGLPTGKRAGRTRRCAEQARGRGVRAGARASRGPACLHLAARLVRGLEAIRAEEHEAVDIPAAWRARGVRMACTWRAHGMCTGTCIACRGRLSSSGHAVARRLHAAGGCGEGAEWVRRDTRGVRGRCGARRMDGSDQPYTAALSAPCSGMQHASHSARM